MIIINHVSGDPASGTLRADVWHRLKAMRLALIFLLFALPADATIAFVTQGAGCGSNTGVPASLTITAGDTVFVITTVTPTSVAVTSITGGGTYAQRATVTNGIYKIELWSTAAGAATTSSSATVNFTGTPTGFMVVTAADYSGVLGLGNTNTNTGSGANPTVSVTTQDLNNWVLAGFLNTVTAATAGTGNLRRSVNECTTPINSINDNTAVNPGTVVNTITHAADTWAAVAIELRTLQSGARRMTLIGVGP